MRFFLTLCLALTLAACGETATRVLLDPSPSTQKIRASVRTVEVAQVSLPDYAAALEISVQTEGGTLAQVPDVLWADEPARGLTAALVRQLATITGVQVAAEPWPLADLPEAEVTVRVEQMAVLQDGRLRLSGQYGIRYDNEDRRGHLHLFDFTSDVADATDVSAIARAHDDAWRQLAEDIATSL